MFREEGTELALLICPVLTGHFLMKTGNRTNSLFCLMALAASGCLMVLSGCSKTTLLEERLPRLDASLDVSVAQISPEPPAQRKQALNRATVEASIAELNQLYADYAETVEIHLITPLRAIASQSRNGRTADFLDYETNLDVPRVRDSLLIVESAINRLDGQLDSIDQESEPAEAAKQSLGNAKEAIEQINRVVIVPLSPRQIPSEEIFKAAENSDSNYREEVLSLLAISDELESIEGNLNSIKGQIDILSAAAANTEAANAEATNDATASTTAAAEPVEVTDTVASVISSVEAADFEQAFSGIEQAIAQIQDITIEAWSPRTTVFVSSASDQARAYRLDVDAQSDAIRALQRGLPPLPSSSIGTYDAATFAAVEQFIDEQNSLLRSSLSELSPDGLPVALSSWLPLLLIALGFLAAAFTMLFVSKKRSAPVEAAAVDLKLQSLEIRYDQLVRENEGLTSENQRLLQASRPRLASYEESPPNIENSTEKSTSSPELDGIIETVRRTLAISEADVKKVYNTDYQRLREFVTVVEHTRDSIEHCLSGTNSADNMRVETRKGGKYWVIRRLSAKGEKGDRSYLLLRKDEQALKINKNNVKFIKSFFSLENEHAMRNEFELIAPSVVEKIDKKGIEQWKLKQVGTIRFKENPEAD